MKLGPRFAFAAAVVVLFVLLAGVGSAYAGSTLDKVRARGKVLCATAGNLYSDINDYNKPGNLSGFNRDICRAIAAATLSDSMAVKFVLVVPQNRFKALQEGAIDVLDRGVTWTLTRDTSLGIRFVAIDFYDGQGFLANKDLRIKSLLELGGKGKDKGRKTAVCVEKDTTSRDNVAEYIRDNDLPIRLIEFNAFEEALYAFISRRCDIYTSDMSHLTEVRADQVPKPDDYVILDNVISKEPLAASVRDDDPQWLNIVRWVIFATIQAEELGITSANVDTLRKNGTTAQKRFLGSGSENLGKGLGLNGDWAYQIIRSVGNYGEIFERNMGAGTVYNLKRGMNDLWTRGGLMYAPPFR